MDMDPLDFHQRENPEISTDDDEPVTIMTWHADLSTDLSPQLKSWLQERGSMTERIRGEAHHSFSLELVSETPTKLSLNEQTLLHTQEAEARLRQIYLHCDNQPWLFGYTLLPLNLLQDLPSLFDHLANQPIGTILFNRQDASRTELKFKQLSPQHPLNQKALANLPNQSLPLWARRSIFKIANARLLIYEVFLPALVKSLTQ